MFGAARTINPPPHTPIHPPGHQPNSPAIRWPIRKQEPARAGRGTLGRGLHLLFSNNWRHVLDNKTCFVSFWHHPRDPTWSAYTEESAFTLLMLSIPICCDNRRELRWGLDCHVIPIFCYLSGEFAGRIEAIELFVYWQFNNAKQP